MPRRVLVVDDEESIRWSLVERLRADGHETIEAASAREAIARAAEGVDLVLLDCTLPDDEALSALGRLRELDPDVSVIALSARRHSTHAIEAMKAGAVDDADRPFDLDDLSIRVARALETTRLRRELRTVHAALSKPYGAGSIVGESEPMQRVKALVGKIAASPGSTVLITGESGTGKNLIARVIHYASRRAARPFLEVACSALPEAVLEAEMFGREHGAVAGVLGHKRGALEQADEGTILLDEIGDMTAALQARLLRFLEEKTFRRVGGSSDVQVDVRVIAATDRHLEEHVRQGRFREDLFYRLNVLRVETPPLRARDADIPLLARHFVEAFSTELNRPMKTLGRRAEGALQSYTWPGNVRELRNLIERAVLLSKTDVLQTDDFESLHMNQSAAGHRPGEFNLPAQGVQLEELEKSLVAQALDRTGGNQTRAAALLGLHRDQIRYRIEKFSLGRKH